MKKRILSILLTICMLFCLTPISVFAEEVGAGGSAAIQLGADALSVLSKNVNTATAPTVYFGQNHENNPAAWRVIGYDGSGVTSSQGDITLLAAGAMGVIPFVDTILNNEYAPSNLKTAIDALAEKLTTEENAAVKKRALTSGSYNGENTDCVAGGQVDNAVFWPLSTAEAFAVNNDLRALEPAHPNWVTTAWWLRSPGFNKYHLAVVTSDGSVQYSGHTILIFNNHRTVRPAFKLNMNSVLFASAAVGGKPDGGLTPIPEYSGNEWKLTLLDSSRNFAVTEKTADGYPDDTIMLNYSGATTGANEYISVIIADNNGAQYYGRVAQPTAESGTVEIKIPSDIAPGDYTLKIFNEQYNGDYNTDYASNFTDIALTVENQPDEQFTLAPGGRYYFDLSAMNIPGTVNTGNIFGVTSLPDTTLHYVPFTYAGTVNAYKLTTEMATTEEYAQKNKYPHSLFVADYAVTNDVSWDALNTADLIFGKDYASGGVDYTLRAPSVGSNSTGSGDSQRGVPQSNEWDTMLNKNSGYIQNWNAMYSWGQDAYSTSYRAVRGYNSARHWLNSNATRSTPSVGFRPVLEVLNSDTLGSGGLKVVTLDLGGGKLGISSDAIQIIVKNGSEFTAPASDGLTRPDGNTGSYFMWLDGNGKSYEPGDSVPADVTELTVQWTAPTYTVTLHANGGTINNGNVTSYTYGVGATLPTADDMTYTGHTFKGWYDNESLTGSPVTAIGNTETGNKEYWAKWEINQYTITVKPENGKADITITQDYGTPITAPTLTREGYQFNGWDKTFPTTMPAENLTITAQWRYNGGGGSGYSYYTIKATAGAGGSISPSGNVSVREGRDQTFTITPDKGYAVANVKIDGKSIGAVKSYTFENVRRTHTIEVIFMKANGNPQTGVFVDVATGSYYEDAVDWAVENGITTGVSANRFDPNGVCTRAQAVTFLWRAAGSPAPRSRTMPFTDVPVGSYYYDAVLWAVENGITKGTSETRFSPDATCSRAQIVAFLWRSEKSPAAGSRNPFADVKSTAYYADAVLWAVREDITKGTTSTTFSPDADCTRAQIVTFLWRCKK